MKQLLIILFLLTSAKGFCFPDMRNYPHKLGDFKGKPTASSLNEDAIEISKCSFEDFNGYLGHCQKTGYRIYIEEVNGNPICTLRKDGHEDETSFFQQEIPLDDGLAFYFYFKRDPIGGRLIVIFWPNGTKDALWQTWLP